MKHMLLISPRGKFFTKVLFIKIGRDWVGALYYHNKENHVE